VFQDPKKETEKRKEQKIKESQRQFLQTQYGYCLLHGVILGIFFLFSLFCFSFYIYAALSFFRIFFGNLPKLSCTYIFFHFIFMQHYLSFGFSLEIYRSYLVFFGMPVCICFMVA
jgi:hypothetical protein